MGLGSEQGGANRFILWEDVLSTAELDAIERLGDRMIQQTAELALEGEVDRRVRSTRIAWIRHGPETAALYQRITQLVRHLNETIYRFDITGIEALQYTVYHQAEGGHYDWHVDYGPHNPQPRKLSFSLQLTDPAQYEGCDLQFQVGPQIGVGSRARGAIIAFPSFFLHRVTPITAGVRKSLVVWATGPDFR